MDKKTAMIFSSINKVDEILIPSLEEIKGNGTDMVYYGTDNRYPEYLFGLYTDCTSLKTVINGIADYVAGNDVLGNYERFERPNKKMTWTEFVTALARDFMLYGGFAYEKISTKNLQDTAELHYIDFRNLRSSEDNETFFYNPDFKKRYVKSSKTIILPKFEKSFAQPESIVYYKNSNSTSTTYPIPLYSGALKCCEIERSIDEMHLGGIKNGFYGSFIINIPTGIPSEEEQDEIEQDVTEKFCGSANAGRFILNFSNGKDGMADIQKLDTVDFGDKYQAAAKRSREQIYAAFRAIPALFGVMTETTGFNEQEFSEAFKLFNRTMIQPIQKIIVSSINNTIGMDNVIEIKPFSLNNEKEEIVDEQ